jgi:hypothetical protein
MADETGPGPGEQRFAELAAGLRGEPDVQPGTGFGTSPGLRVGGRIFAMSVRGELVVKLPAGRVDELVAAGSGRRFERGEGRPMKEWLTVPTDTGTGTRADWPGLAAEALAFVRAAAGSRS